MNRVQTVAFLLLWMTYFLTYCLRKPLGIYKFYIESEFHLSEADLGWTDVSLLLPYAVVQILGASLWDSVRPSHVIAFNLTLAAVAMMLISLVHHYELFCLLVAISGAAQAPLWPACIKIVSSHVDGSSLATIVGLLGTAPYAGATFSAAFVTYIADRSSWRYGLLPIFVSCLVVSLFVLVFLRLGSVGPSKRPTCTTAEQGNSYRKLFAISGVPEVTVAAACLKFGRYALYMWLPLFLTQYLNYSMAKSAVLSSAFDIGGAIGGPLIGYFVDNSKEKLKTLFKVTVLGSIAMAAFALAGSWFGSLWVAVLLVCIGICNCGPDSILIGAITVEMGNANSMNAGAGLTSLVNGIGSFGGVIEGPLLGLLVTHFGWSSVLVAIVASASIAALALLKANNTTMKLHAKKLDPDDPEASQSLV